MRTCPVFLKGLQVSGDQTDVKISLESQIYPRSRFSCLEAGSGGLLLPAADRGETAGGLLEPRTRQPAGPLPLRPRPGTELQCQSQEARPGRQVHDPGELSVTESQRLQRACQGSRGVGWGPASPCPGPWVGQLSVPSSLFQKRLTKSVSRCWGAGVCRGSCRRPPSTSGPAKLLGTPRCRR